MPKVILEHVDRKGYGPVDVSLYHECYCRYAAMCTCRSITRPGPKGKQHVHMLPGSFSIAPGGRTGEMDSAVLHIPQVQELLRRRVLVRIDVPDASLPPPPAELSTAPEPLPPIEAPKSRRRRAAAQ